METLGERLKRLRLARGLTLSELARKSGVNIATISLIEHNKYKNPTAKTIKLLAKTLSIPADFLLEVVGEKNE